MFSGEKGEGILSLLNTIERERAFAKFLYHGRDYARKNVSKEPSLLNQKAYGCPPSINMIKDAATV